MKKLIFFLVVLVSMSVAEGQINPVRLAQSRMKKGKWVPAEVQIKKSLRKDSINPEAKFVYAQWYFSPTNHHFSIDSAYQYALRSLESFNAISDRDKDRLHRFPIDSTILIDFREQIDSAGFERAKSINTEEAYVSFLDEFKFAKQKEAAIELRNEVAYLDALKINTYESFLAYVQRYPQSQRADDAKNRYEKLLFESKTKDGKLSSYESFLKEYSKTPYRSIVEKKIFEISTASGSEDDFISFTKKYSSSHYVNRARDLLYHINKENNKLFPSNLLSDSLRNVQKLEEGSWIPIYRGGFYGFINDQGHDVVTPQFKSIDQQYLCGDVTSDYIVTSKGIISRTGEVVYKGDVLDTEDVGFGFLLVESKNCKSLIHKSSFRFISSCISDVIIIANHFLAIQIGSNWGLYAFNGKEILPPTYSRIASFDELIVLTRTGKMIIQSMGEIIQAADGNKLEDDLVFDEVRPLGEGKYLVRNGTLEGVLNHQLKYDLPLDRQSLTKTNFGYIRKRYQQYSVMGLSSELEKESYDQILPYGNWIALRKSNGYQIFRQDTKKFFPINFDSVWLSIRVVFASAKDSMHVFLQAGRRIAFSKQAPIHFMKSADSAQFIYSPEKNRNWIYELVSGTRLFTFEFDEIEYLMAGYFLVTKSKKKGLINMEGKVVLPLEYDAILLSGKKYVSILKDRKFGIFDPNSKTLIKPEYERNVVHVDDRWLVGYRGGYGFISSESKPLSQFEFEEIRPWNDSCVIVKKNFQWMIYEVESQKMQISGINRYSFVNESMDERVVIINKGLFYGVLSNKRGIILEATFDDIINVGSPERPLYFAEKYVEEAGIHVVIYYDHNGKFLRRQVYDTDEYEKIYCDSN